MDIRPAYEDSIGAQLLTDVLTFPSNIKERHDTLEFINHIYIRHTVRLVVDVGAPPQPTKHGAAEYAPYRAWGQGALETDRGQVVVPLGYLDRHSRTTTHVTDETGTIVPLFTAGELNRRLGGGLVCYAAKILKQPSPPELIEHLRGIPAHAEGQEFSSELTPQEVADAAFDEACGELLKFRPQGFELLRELPFRHALAVVTTAVQLLIEVDPSPGSMRVFSYSYVRPINPPRASRAKQTSGRVRRLVAVIVTPARRARRLIKHYIKKSGTSMLNIELGPLGSCERYHLSAEAPFDTWFAQASLSRDAGAGPTSEVIDTSQQFRLDYRQNSTSMPWSGTLLVELRTVFTGVARAGYYASLFLAGCATVGLARVVFSKGHVLLDEDVDAAASLLLLFPGIAASAVAGAASNTLTATLQFPTRLILWGLSILSFVLAVSGAFKLGGVPNIVLWGAATAVAWVAAGILRYRKKTWNQGS